MKMPPRKLEYEPVERKVLVLLKTDVQICDGDEHYWKLTGEKACKSLQEWVDTFFEVKAGKEYHWEILYATSTYIIVERTKWEKINKD